MAHRSVIASGLLYNQSSLTMKQKIVNALKTKYQRFGLSNEAIDRIASAKEKTVTGESEIEGAIADAQTMELIATELQKMRDKEIQSRTDLQTSFNEYKEKHPEATPPTPPTPPTVDEPEWAKKLRESNERIEARFKAEDDAKNHAAALSAVEAKLKEEISKSSFNQGVFKATLKGFALGEKEEIDDAVKRLKTDYDAALKETFGDGPIPGVSVNAFEDAKSATEAKNAFLRQQGLLPKEDNK